MNFCQQQQMKLQTNNTLQKQSKKKNCNFFVIIGNLPTRNTLSLEKKQKTLTSSTLCPLSSRHLD